MGTCVCLNETILVSLWEDLLTSVKEHRWRSQRSYTIYHQNGNAYLTECKECIKFMTNTSTANNDTSIRPVWLILRD